MHGRIGKGVCVWGGGGGSERSDEPPFGRHILYISFIKC